MDIQRKTLNITHTHTSRRKRFLSYFVLIVERRICAASRYLCRALHGTEGTGASSVHSQV